MLVKFQPLTGLVRQCSLPPVDSLMQYLVKWKKFHKGWGMEQDCIHLAIEIPSEIWEQTGWVHVQLEQ